MSIDSLFTTNYKSFLIQNRRVGHRVRDISGVVVGIEHDHAAFTRVFLRLPARRDGRLYEVVLALLACGTRRLREITRVFVVYFHGHVCWCRLSQFGRILRRCAARVKGNVRCAHVWCGHLCDGEAA